MLRYEIFGYKRKFILFPCLGDLVLCSMIFHKYLLYCCLKTKYITFVPRIEMIYFFENRVSISIS